MLYGTRIPHKGYTLRSKTEHAWALWFDWEHIEWEYESKKFRGNPVGVYTPDFWLKKYNVFVEIKPYDQGSWNKIELCKNKLLICFGTPDRHYVRYKPEGAIALHRKHWNDFDAALYEVSHP